jgi:hypothetical protein
MFKWGQAKKRVFIEELNSTKFLGHEDWRLPTLKELLTIVSSGHYNPAVDTDYFPETKADYYYWTSVSYVNPEYAWCVHFASGGNFAVHKWNSSSYGRYARAVRGDLWDPDPYLNNFDGTVSDSDTGLTWQQLNWEPPDTPAKMNWKDALAYCNTLADDGVNLTDGSVPGDWRLPNRIELQSIVDYTRYDPSINTDVFPDTPRLSFWTSTSMVYHQYAAPEAQAATVNFLSGGFAHKHKREAHHVRCVYGGHNTVHAVFDAGCTDNADCDDGLFCNGTETCDSVGGCQAGTTVDCDDGIDCTVDSCNETTDSCDNVPNDGFCDDGLFCNGSETCVDGTCQDEADPCLPSDVCLEDSDTCCTPSAEACEDGSDNDCDGYVDCDDLEDCGDDPACVQCLPKRARCSSNEQCCSNKCSRRGRCR